MTREEVVKGLECCVVSSHPDCKNCRYDEIVNCAGTLMRDAYALLKAQEPRVMTLEEWKNLPDPDDGTCLCYEIKDCGLRAMLIKTFAGSVHLYGKAFRCWTSRPDEKRRAETPWEN